MERLQRAARFSVLVSSTIGNVCYPVLRSSGTERRITLSKGRNTSLLAHIAPAATLLRPNVALTWKASFKSLQEQAVPVSTRLAPMEENASRDAARPQPAAATLHLLVPSLEKLLQGSIEYQPAVGNVSV